LIPWGLVVYICAAHSRVLCCGACGSSGESALGAVEEATAEAAKHGDRSEVLAALVTEGDLVCLTRARSLRGQKWQR
jgi:hypothetical protein